jgi:hypothetical protein
MLLGCFPVRPNGDIQRATHPEYPLLRQPEAQEYGGQETQCGPSDRGVTHRRDATEPR